jgi:peptidoglycan/xylan/chitin deacetylase (PgdA/CDA1 family)
MDRRSFLGVLAAGVAATLSGCSGLVNGRPGELVPRLSKPPKVPHHDAVRPPVAQAALATPPPAVPTGGLVQAQTIDRLTSSADGRFALTVDDGVSTEVLDAYLDFVKQSGIRITFFVNGMRPSWTTLRAKLAPLVESGQAQLANHTWSHPTITTLSEQELRDELDRNEAFLQNMYGVSSMPYFRPPYGRHTDWTDSLTNAMGYAYTITWYGSLGDSTVLTPQQIVANAREWFLPGRIVIGHANHPAVTHTYGELLDIIRSRQLRTVTLHDAFAV